MNSKHLLVAAVALAAGAALFFALSGGKEPPPGPLAGPGASRGEAAVVEAAGAAEEPEATGGRQAARAAVEAEAGDPALDPAIRAALCGFRGRVLDHTGAAVPELTLQLLRFAPDSLFGEQPQETIATLLEPRIDAGRGVTDTSGKFQITGVWPDAFYAMILGGEGEAAGLRVIAQSPGPGEIVDLGDIRLDPTAMILGVVVGEEGEPVAGALVRAADLPGAFTTMVPLERLDPDGAVIIYEGEMRRVVEFPQWVAGYFERLPIPSTLSGADGSFRLEGVLAGNNMLAVTAPRRLSYVQPRLRLKAGEERDVGEIELRAGEEVWGRVVDHRGVPVADAQVLVGQAGGIAPVSFAAWAEPTNAKGEFSLAGFRGGKIVAAARRSVGDPWVVSEPVPVARDLRLQLPGAFQLAVTVQGPGGVGIANADFRLIPDAAEDEMWMVARLGFLQAAPLEQRVHAEGGGRYVFDSVAAGSYRLEVTATDYDLATESLEVEADLERTITLAAVSRGTVIVVDEREAPIRNAAVYARHGLNGDDIPRFCGRTDGKGRFALHHTAEGKVDVSAQHPAYGWVSTETQLPNEEIRLVMRAPGGLRGVMTEDGEPPELGKYMIVLTRRDSGQGGDEVNMPRLATVDPLGNFAVQGLQPGWYGVSSVPSVQAIRSLGSIFEMAQAAMFMGGDGGTEEANVQSGLVAEVVIARRTEADTVDGPSAHVTGTVLVNGRPGTGFMVRCWSGGRRAAEVDEAGRFDLGRLPAGSVDIELYDTQDSSAIFSQALLHRTLELEENKDVDVAIQIDTGAVSGVVIGPDGDPAGRCEVELTGSMLPTSTNPQPGMVRLSAASDDVGAFEFERVPSGAYNVTAESQVGRGTHQGVQVVAGSPTTGVQVRLERLYRVSGRVDLAAMGEKAPGWAWLQLNPEAGAAEQRTRSSSIDREDGSFTVDGLTPGRYRAEITAFFPDPEAEERWSGEQQEFVHEGVIELGTADLTGVMLRPVKKVEEEPGPSSEAVEVKR